MNIIDFFNSFQTQEQALEFLETIRWKGQPVCPYCRSHAVSRHASSDRAGPRWQCQRCSRAFSVTVGTIFHGTHLSLRRWFLLLALTQKPDSEASISKLARDMGMRRPTVAKVRKTIGNALSEEPAQARLLRAVLKTGKQRARTTTVIPPSHTGTA